jgi:nucleoside-diphosphate-sugar epimerase
MKVLITGISGFVGSCLARRLIKEGHEVHAFTRVSSDPWRFADIRERITEHVVDLRDGESVTRTVAGIRPQLVYHCAAHGGFASQQDTTAILESNFLGTVNLLRACERTGFDYFVHTGSSSEYGTKDHPLGEEDMLEPIGDYSVSKAAATLFCRSEGMHKQLPVVTLRLFSPFGPWDDPKRLVPYVMKSLLRNETPRLSTPSSVRDYIFINDIVDAYLAVVQQPFYGDIFNIGSGVQHSLGDVVAAVKTALACGPEPAWGATQKQRPEPKVWVARIDKAREKFNWKPATPLQAGLEQTAAWMKEQLAFYP